MAQIGVGFNDGTLLALQQPLDSSRVKSRKDGRDEVTYLEAWDVIDTANSVFGFDQWTLRVVEVTVMDLGVRAIVEVNVSGVTRQDMGFNAYAVAAEKPPTKKAMDTSLKGAVSDAMKRAFRTFGPQFGNNLYDKENDVRPENQGSQQNRQSNRRQSGEGQQQAEGQRRTANGVATDESGGEVLTGRALQFRQYVEGYEVSWEQFLAEVLETETLQGYFDDGGTATGAVDAFRTWAKDQGINLEQG